MARVSWMRWSPMPEPVHSPFIVRAGTLVAIRDAQQIKDQAARDRACVLGMAEAEANSIRLVAKQNAAASAAALLAAAAATADKFREDSEAELTDLAFAIANRLIGALPRDARTAMLVQTALTEHRDWSRLVVRVSPDVATAMRLALQSDAVEVRADETLADDACILLHPAGRTELGPVAQFRALLKAIPDGTQ